MITKKTIVLALPFLLLACTALAKSPFGEISGDIRLVGKEPEINFETPVEYQQDSCGTKLGAGVIKLWKNRVTDVTLWLTSKEGLAETTTEEVNVVGWRCEFRPKMLPAVPGTKIRISNEDEKMQWVVIEGDGIKKRQVMLKSGEKPIEITVKPQGEIKLVSAFYPWMEAWIRPTPNLISVTTTIWDGRFFFKDVPPGEYILHTWHRSLGEITQEIKVESRKKTKVRVKFDHSASDKNIPIIKASTLEKLLGSDKEKVFAENPFKKK